MLRRKCQPKASAASSGEERGHGVLLSSSPHSLPTKSGFFLASAKPLSLVPKVSLGLLAILSITALSPIGSMGGMRVEEAHADDGSIATLSGWLSSSVTLTMADTVEESIEPTTSGTFKNLATVARVQVANADYYDVSIKGEPNMTNSSSNSTDAIAAITLTEAEQANGGKKSDSFAANTWGYSATKNETGVTTAIPATKDTTYKAITASSQPVGEQNKLADLQADDYYTLNFGAKVDTSLPAGTYSSTVTLSVVASPKLVTGFDRTDTMQGMTANICREIGSSEDIANGTASKYAATDSLGQTYYTKRLKDLRDGKYYWVAKLADGNCWMTQNLALDIPSEGLTSELTALREGVTSWKPAEATRTPATPNRFTLPCIGASTSNPVTINGIKYTNETSCLNADAGYSWDEGIYVMIYPGEGHAGLRIGMNARDDNNNPGGAGVQDGLSSLSDRAKIITQSTVERKNATELASLENSKVLTNYGVVMDVSSGWTVSSDPDFIAKHNGYAIDLDSKTYDAHYLFGNYYQWLAATAQTVAQGQALTDDEAGTKVDGSICARGWELPTSGSYGEDTGAAGLTYNAANNSYFNLINKTSRNALTVGGTTAGSNADVNNGSSPIGKMIGSFNGDEVKTENILTGAPMHFFRAGNVYPANSKRQVRVVGSFGNYWSSIVASTANARFLRFYVDEVSPSYSEYRSLGFPVRCLVNTAE